MLTSVLIVLGLFFLNGLPLDLLPTIVYPQLRAGVSNPGVEPQVLEETVAKRLEAALATTENVTNMQTEVREGRVGVNLTFSYGTDIDFALQDASKNLERARGGLPEEADPPSINKFDPNQSPVYEVAFSSETRDLVSLREWVEYRLRPQFLTIEGVASVDISGGLVREIQVVLDQERLRSYGLTVSQVIEAVRSANQDVAAGRVSSPTREVVGKTAGKFRTVDDVKAVLLTVTGGGRVPLSEIASVRDTHREQRLWARLNGVPAVKASVRKQPNANTVSVAEQVDQRLAALKAGNFTPADIDYQTIQNQADFIRKSVGSVESAALLGALLAMIVVFLFLGSLRKTLIVGAGIPIAILATFIMMGLGKLTLNIMSLGGLALGVGMLVDNSIVMLENIFRHREEGQEDVEEAAHEGAAEVQSAVVASTATNLAAVVPFLLISGLAALIFRELILTISFAILASLGVALTVVPMLSAQLAKIRFSSGVKNWFAPRWVDAGMRAPARPLSGRDAPVVPLPLGRARRGRGRARGRVLRYAQPRQRVPPAGGRRQRRREHHPRARRVGAGDRPGDPRGRGDDRRHARRRGALRHGRRLPLRRVHEPEVRPGVHRRGAGAGLAAHDERRRLGPDSSRRRSTRGASRARASSFGRRASGG